MRDYYNIRQRYGQHTILHGLRSHPTVLEWLHILRTKYEKLGTHFCKLLSKKINEYLTLI